MVTDHQEDYPSVTAASQAVVKQLGLGRETVRRWVVQADVDSGGRPHVNRSTSDVPPAAGAAQPRVAVSVGSFD